MAVDNPSALYELGVKVIEEGGSPGELELELDLDPYLDFLLIQEVMPLLRVLFRSKRLSETGYTEWLQELIANPLSAGIPGLIVTLSAIVLSLFLSYQASVLLGLRHSNPMVALLIAVLCIPFLGLLGIPLFAATRSYWRWRAERVERLHGPSLSSRPARLETELD